MGTSLYHNYYATRFPYDQRKKAVWKEIVRYLRPWLSGKVVDIGTGHGYFLDALPSGNRIGIDLLKSPHFPKGAAFIKGSIVHLDRVVKNADVMFASNVLEHLDDEELSVFMSSLKKALRPQGYFIILQPNFRYAYKNYFDDYTHKKVFTHSSLCDFLEAQGFTLIKVMPKFLPFSAASALPISSLLVRMYLHSPIKPMAGQMLIIAQLKEHQ